MTRRRWCREDRGDGGGHALELLIIAPVLVAFVCLLVGLGRVAAVGSKVDAAAASAARAASQQANGNDAQQAAQDAGSQAMSDAGLTCTTLSVDTDTSAFTLPVGQPGSVQVSITCTLDLSDVAFPGLPGSTTVSGRAASPVDIYQER